MYQLQTLTLMDWLLQHNLTFYVTVNYKLPRFKDL